jgi:hypothetical protein
MVMTLLQTAIVKSKKSRFLLADFPLTLELALAFEAQFCPFQLLVESEKREKRLRDKKFRER